MRRRLRLITALVFAILMGGSGWFFSSALAAGPAVRRHSLLIRLYPKAHQLSAIDRLSLPRNPKSPVVFELASHLAIQTVTLGNRPVDYRFRQGRLTILLSDGEADRNLEISYGGVFNDAVSARPLNTDNPGYGVTGTIQPRGALLLAGANWYPRSLKTKDTYTLTVDAPQGVLAVAAGHSLGHTSSQGRTLSRWEVDHPLRGLSLVAGPLRLATRKFGRITAATYFSDAIQSLSPDYLAAVGRYIKFYEQRFGPYPFSQFAVVENFFPTGYGFPSFTLMGRQVLQLPFIIHTSLGHEIAHCWWGNGVLVDPSSGNWSEGLTTYVADYLYKEQQGKGIAYRRQWLRNYANLVKPPNEMSISEFSSRTDPLSKTVGYDKAAMVFHMLRRTVGDGIFWQTLRDVYARYRFQAISWRHWQRAFEQASGRSLEGYFNQWLYRPGAPYLQLSQVAAVPDKGGYRISGQIMQTKPYYSLNVDLVLQTDNQTEQSAWTLSGPATTFSIRASSAPRMLTVDPEVHIFRRLAQQELPLTVNSVKGSDSLTVVVAQEMDAEGLSIAQRLTTALGVNAAAIVKEERFAQSHLSNNLVFVGQPRDPQWWTMADPEFQISDQMVTLSGQAYPRRTSSFFGVFQHPGNKAKFVALFLPASDDLARAVSTKIPHYGKYSYLLFDKQRNQVKGTWPVNDSPLIYKWSPPGSASSQQGAL